MRHRIYSLSLVFAVLLTLGTAQASPTLQVKALTASRHVQTWRSSRFPSNEVVEAHLFSEGKELSQEGYEHCGAWYVDKTLSVRLDVVNCQSTSPDTQTWYVLHYSGVKRAQRFTVKLFPLRR
jgi:hypothetical protein